MLYNKNSGLELFGRKEMTMDEKKRAKLLRAWRVIAVILALLMIAGIFTQALIY